MQIRETARTWFEGRSKPGGGPRVRGQALPPSQGRLPPIPLNILGKILEAMGRGRVSGRMCVNPVTQGGSTSPAAKKAGYLLCREKGKTKGPSPHSPEAVQFLPLNPSPSSQLSCQGTGWLLPAGDKDSEWFHLLPSSQPSHQGGFCSSEVPTGLQPPLCVSGEVSPLNVRAWWERFLRPLPTPASLPGSFCCTSLVLDCPP